MAFEFIISQLDSIPSLDGMDKVISTIHWRAQKAHEDFTADTYGAVSLEAPHEASFTPYSEVTEAMVISWLESSLDCNSIELNLDSQIDNYINPPLIAYNLPWESKI